MEVLVGAIGIIALLVLILLGTPIGVALLAVGFTGFAYLVSPVAALHLIAEEVFLSLSSYSLAVLPLFFLMGQLAYQAGMSTRLFATAYTWMGHLPGGLAIAAVGGCAGFSAISGSSSATAATMGMVALPEMRKYKYDLSMATGAIAAGGTLGILIPPSVVLIIYGIQTEQSIGQLFVAGILPGILLSCLFIAAIVLMSLRNRNLGPQGPRTTFRQKIKSLPGALEAVILFGLVMGGLLAGWFTPTEAGGVGALGALAIGLVRRKISLRELGLCSIQTAQVVAMLFMILAGAMLFGKFLAVSRIPSELAQWAVNLPVPKVVILVLVMAIYAVGGCIMDATVLPSGDHLGLLSHGDPAGLRPHLVRGDHRHPPGDGGHHPTGGDQRLRHQGRGPGCGPGADLQGDPALFHVHDPLRGHPDALPRHRPGAAPDVLRAPGSITPKSGRDNRPGRFCPSSGNAVGL